MALYGSLMQLFKLGTHTQLNKVLVANAWVGSYRIRDPNDYLNSFPSPKRWSRYNEIIQPPQLDPNEERRPATYHHQKDNIKSSPKKMWYTIKFIRGMSVDEAVKQLTFMPTKPAQILKEILLEAQDNAVKLHDFEFKSDMWIEEAICGKGLVIKGLRKHARRRFGEIRYFYCHVMLKLTEGKPPKHYYRPERDGNDLLKKYYEDLRSRKVELGYW